MSKAEPSQSSRQSGVGCACGWPLDPCNRAFTTDGRCGRAEFEADNPPALTLDQRIDKAVDEHLGTAPGAIVNPGLNKVLKAILKDVLGDLERSSRPDPRSAFIGG